MNFDRKAIATRPETAADLVSWVARYWPLEADYTVQVTSPKSPDWQVFVLHDGRGYRVSAGMWFVVVLEHEPCVTSFDDDHFRRAFRKVDE